MLPKVHTKRLALSLSHFRPIIPQRCTFRTSAVFKPKPNSKPKERDELGGADPGFIRPLGSVEEMFAAYSEIGASSFSLAVRIRGNLNRSRLESGIRRLQHSNGHLSLAIRTSTSSSQNGRRYFARSEEPIPLRVVDLSSTKKWEEAMEADLAMPFPNDGPLVRITALLGDRKKEREEGEEEGEREHILVPTFHHSLADGLSGVAIIRDLVQAISGHHPSTISGHGTSRAGYESSPIGHFVGGSSGGVSHGIGETLEHTLGEAFPSALASLTSSPPPPEFPPPRNIWGYNRCGRPRIQSLALSCEFTKRLVARAKGEGTTVSAVLVAALAQARYSLRKGEAYPGAGDGESTDKDGDGLRVLVPFDARGYAKTCSETSRATLGVGMGVFIGAVVLAVPPLLPLSTVSTPRIEIPSETLPQTQTQKIWTQARTLGTQIHGQKSLTSTLQLACSATLQMQRDATSREVMEFMRTGTDHEVLVTNLGILDSHLPRKIGDFEVQEIWPVALKTCIQGEDNIGVATFGGKLRLVHVSLDGAEGLLHRMVEILEERTCT